MFLGLFWNGNFLTIDGRFVSSTSGQPVGQFRRTIDLKNYEAHNILMEINRDSRSKNFTEKFLEATELWCKSLGVNNVLATCVSSVGNSDSNKNMVGAYVWADMNYYQWSEKPVLVIQRIKDLFIASSSSEEKKILKNLIDRFDGEDMVNFPTPFRIANINLNQLGKRIMISNLEWGGIRKI